MVGQDSWLVALGSPADHHVQHPIRRFNVMFLQQQQQKKNFSKQSEKIQAGLNNHWLEMDHLRGLNSTRILPFYSILINYQSAVK